MFGETLGSYLARDKAPGIIDEAAGEPAPITIEEIHGGKPDAVVTGITRIETRPLCRNCDGAVIEGMEEECHVCGGSGYRPARGLDDYSNGFQPDADFMEEAA